MNTENTNCFIYETEELLIELLGGVRIEGLDRMRVTMKVSVVNRSATFTFFLNKSVQIFEQIQKEMV